MNRRIAIVGAPSSIGIRPYDTGGTRRLDRAPDVLRQQAIVERLGAIDLGDVAPPAYRDYVRPPGHARNQPEVLEYCTSLGDRIAMAVAQERFVVLLGGDCSIVLGALLGTKRAVGGPVGLVYVDAHADFATPEESQTGSVASMCLGLAVGRGDTPLARIGGQDPLVLPEHVALLGRRDAAEPSYGHAALAESPILDLPGDALVARGFAEAARAALARVASANLRGFWIHLDADVLNPIEMPAVDSPEPGGPMLGQIIGLLKPLVEHPRALGMELTIYDPALDADQSCATRLATLLETLCSRGSRPGRPG